MTEPALSVSDDDLVADLAQAAAELTAEEFKAYFRLRDYQRTRGRVLPPREKNLAVIAGVTLSAFRNMRAALGDFLPLGHVPTGVTPEPEKDAAKQAAGKLGAQRRWANRDGRSAIDLATARPIDSATLSAMHSAITPMAKPMAERIADSPDDPPRADGLTDGFSDNKSDSKSQSVSPSDAGAGDGRTDSGNRGGGDGRADGGPDGKDHGHDDGPGALLAMVSATGTGGIARPVAVVLPSDEDIETVVRVAARKDGKPFLDPGWKSQSLFERVRAWIADGISLRDDYRPALETYAARSKGPVRNPANDEIRKMADELRIKHVVPPEAGVMVFEGTPAGDAYVAYFGKSDIFPMEREGRRYGLYRSEWPPAQRPLLAAKG